MKQDPKNWAADCAMQRFNILEPINYNYTFFSLLSHGMGYVEINICIVILKYDLLVLNCHE